MSLEPCWLTHHTGTYIRFRPSQAPKLPDHDVDLTIELYDGQTVPGRFHLNPANPYVGGPKLLQFIRSRVPFRSKEQALISVIGRHWRLFEPDSVGAEAARYGLDEQRARVEGLTGRDLGRILARIDALTTRSGRRESYERLTRPPALRRLVIGLMGARCQVEHCKAAERSKDAWDDDGAALAVLEVHHIEEVAKVEDHSPANLCVICANHHRLIHGLGPWVVRHESDDVVLSRRGGHLRIMRDLSVLTSQ